MEIYSYIHRKFLRLLSSNRVLKLNYFFHKLFGEKDLGNIGFDFSKKKTRQFIIQDIINSKSYKSYLEIGCFDNELFNYVKCNKKVGVDPYTGGTIRKTSDKFFETNNDKFDCIFIDGLHTYSQVKKDIDNSLKFLNTNGIILLHDCLPDNVFTQAIPRCKKNWNGDVWKAIVEFRTNPDLDVYTCYADHGIGVIFNRKNKNLLKICTTDFHKLKFEEYFNNYKSLMNVISFEELLKVVDL